MSTASIADRTSGSSTPCSARNTIVPVRPAPWPPKCSLRMSKPVWLSTSGPLKSSLKSVPTAPDVPPSSTRATTQSTTTRLRWSWHQEPRRANTRTSEGSTASLGGRSVSADRSSGEYDGTRRERPSGIPLTPTQGKGPTGCRAMLPAMIQDRFRLDDQVAIVTGAGRGIGAATAAGAGRGGRRRGALRRAPRTSSRRSPRRSRPSADGPSSCRPTSATWTRSPALAEARPAELRPHRHRRQQRRRHDAPPVPRHLASGCLSEAFSFNVATAHALTRAAVPIMLETRRRGRRRASRR